jgi:hypothetical protein
MIATSPAAAALPITFADIERARARIAPHLPVTPLRRYPSSTRPPARACR